MSTHAPRDSVIAWLFVGIQFVFLGGGEQKYREQLSALQSSFPEQIGTFLHADFRLPRKVFAGADFMLIPSVFEPGGIVALEALRFGAIPIVRATGGLADIIQKFNPSTAEGNGFRFSRNDAWSLFGSMIEAHTVRRQPKLFKSLIRNGMREDFSWNNVAVKYIDWYDRAERERERDVHQKRRGHVAS